MIFVLLFGAFAVTSCSGRRQGLDAALSAAGSNRPELEKVLAHYRSDPDRRKLKAAEYLISGMPGHYGLVPSPGLDSVKAVLADLYARRKVDSARLEQWRHFRPDNLKKAYDIETITADYLIRNIDMAFEDWDCRPWNRHLDFGKFCELLLPYRVGNEPLEDWRTEYREHFRYITDSVYTGSDPVELVNTVFDTIIDSLFRYNVDFALPSLGGSWLMRNRIGGCRESCDFAVYLLRSIGVPVATDCYFHGSTHTWNVVLEAQGVYMPAMPFSPDFGWSIRDFGPLYVPREGGSVALDTGSVKLYGRVIEYETGSLPEVRDGRVFVSGREVSVYRFTGNYYFFGGDNVLNSRDSRYFGFVPEEYITGIATRILFSRDPYTGRIDWRRTFRRIGNRYCK